MKKEILSDIRVEDDSVLLYRRAKKMHGQSIAFSMFTGAELLLKLLARELGYKVEKLHPDTRTMDEKLKDIWKA